MYDRAEFFCEYPRIRIVIHSGHAGALVKYVPNQMYLNCTYKSRVNRIKSNKIMYGSLGSGERRINALSQPVARRLIVMLCQT